jgi:hypothetical protein
MDRFILLMEQHPLMVEVIAGAAVLCVIDIYADIRSWAKAVKRVAVSEYCRG